MRIYLFMAAAVFAGAVLGFVLLRNGWRRAFGAVVLGHVLAAGGMFLSLRGGSGQMDGLAMAILLSVFVLPAILGLIIGGCVGWWRRGRSSF
ncbi:hypothetical protein [Roseinatronobacter alkalisoli]|uniref:Uncharacterized protein n=1 Tax=Roseinatronobacter alkalisoli TaxID=3028235 RepID=A0ABT5TDH7_9RHOB|nr:hypothetical protein [Roseinatronobacter sp. HJB301]MDD7973183.1 hypothetical protein [Roseinatronobacter sp. HJB301]